MRIVLVSLENQETLFLEFSKVLRGDRGLSAYEEWLAAGNTGTIDDFFYLRTPAIQQANEILEAEAQRVQAEQQRVANEAERQRADQNRNLDFYNISMK